MPRAIVPLVLTAALLAGGCQQADTGSPAGAEASWPLTVSAIPPPVSADSAEPHLGASPHGLILSWIDHDGATATLRFAERTESGWSDARTAAGGDDWFVSGADVPSVVRLRDGTLVAHWYTNTDPRAEAYDLWLSHSRDDGARWSAPFRPHDDGTTTQHGFATLFEPADGGLGLVWLDGRAYEQRRGSETPGAMSLRLATYDAGWSKTSDVEIDDRVCECCTTSVAMTSSGPIVAFRDRSLREIRDIHVSRLENGSWTYPRPVAVDNWRINACPVNGPAIAADGDRAVVAWFTVTDGQPHAYAAFSRDAGRTWGRPIRLDEASTLGYVAVALLDDGSAAASWVELTDSRSRLLVRRIEPSGAHSEAVEFSDGTGPVSGYPRMARLGRDLVFAWTESAGGRQQVRAAAARLP